MKAAIGGREGVKLKVDKTEIKKILEDQLKLLSEYSQKGAVDHELPNITEAMIALAAAINGIA